MFRVTRPYLNLPVKPRFFRFSGKNIIVWILKGQMPFKMHKIIFFSRKKICVPNIFRPVIRNTFFLFGLINSYIHDIKRLFVLNENYSFSTVIVLFNAQINGLHLGVTSPLVKSVYQKIIFLICQPKHMLWVLKRTVSMRRFF